jgi:rhomboid protease GluP
MFKRQTSGSVVCASCGYLVGVKDERCYHCGRRNPGLWGFAPVLRSLGQDLGFVPFVTGTCILVYVLSLLLSGSNIGMSGLNILAPDPCSTLQLGASGGFPVFTLHRWWTVLAAAWLHGNLLHILFNLYAVRLLGPAVAELYGPGRMVIIYTAGSIVGFFVSSTVGFVLHPPPAFHLTLGASASIFGLLGAAVYYGRRSGSRFAYSQALSYAVSMFVFGLIFPGVDNYAHAGGFAGGWLAGRLLDPLHPERVNHMLGAVICLVLSLLSIIVSFLVSTAPFC